MRPENSRDWDSASRTAEAALAASKPADAERALLGYIADHRERTQTADAWLWIGAIRLDGGTKPSSRADALAAFDSASAHGGSRAPGLAAAALKRQVTVADAATRELDQARHALADARQAAASNAAKPSAAQPSLADEVERLKNELAKSNEELARVKRTLRQRRP